jgi:hypothetical protein
MGKFSTIVSAFAKESLTDARKVRNRAVMSLVSDIVKNTPVGDPDLWNIPEGWRARIKASGYQGGTLRANWVVSDSAVSEGDAKKRIDPSGDRTISAANRQLTRIPFGKRVVIANPMFYAHDIEFTDLSVQQGPGDMVRRHVQNWDNHVAMGARQ